jgi:hypothetical protein
MVDEGDNATAVGRRWAALILIAVGVKGAGVRVGRRIVTTSVVV